MPVCRVVAAIDADEFEAQVYQLLPQYQHTIGKPTIVVHPDNDLIICVTSQAKEYGIKRLDKLRHAQKLCPPEKLQIIYQRQRFLKPDTKLVTKASMGIRSITIDFFKDFINKYPSLELGKNIQMEKTGSDELLLDMTILINKILDDGNGLDDILNEDSFEGRRLCLESTEYVFEQAEFLEKIEDLQKLSNGTKRTEFRLAIGGILAAKICDNIKKKMKIVCSAGVGTNKRLAKLACKLNKPNSVTSMTRFGFNRISLSTPFHYIPGFGGDLGDALKSKFHEDLKIRDLQDLFNKDKRLLKKLIGKERTRRIVDIVFGYDENVQHKLFSSIVNSRKKRLMLSDTKEFRKVFNTLTQSIIDKLHDEVVFNKRISEKVLVQYARASNGGKGPLLTESFEMTPIIKLIKSFEVEEPLELKTFFDAAFTAVCLKNPDFKEHLNEIREINFRAINFRSFQKID